MATLLETAQISKREDLSDLVSIADAAATIFSTMCPKGKELGNRKFEWTVDAYEAPSAASVVDGADVDVAVASTDTVNPRLNAVRISNHGHYWRRAFRISPLSETSNVAGIKSEVANGLAKKTIELKRDIEFTLLGAQGSTQVGTATVQPGSTSPATTSVTRGLGKWVQQMQNTASATTLTFDSTWSHGLTVCTPAASVQNTGTAQTAATINVVLASIFAKTGQNGAFDLIAGSALRTALSTLTATTLTAGNFPVATREPIGDDNVFNAVIDVYRGDFGTVRIHTSNFMPSADSLKTGYLIPMDKVELRYGFMPRILELTNNGGGEGRAIEAYAGLVVKNPHCLGKLQLT